MRKQSFLAAVIIAFSCNPCAVWAADGKADSIGSGGSRCPYRRIVSLAPSVTEILFDLGLGDRVVGVTRYCRYPPEAQSKTKVGGYVDPNYEELLRLRPDLTVLLTVHAAAQERLRRLGLATLAVDHTTIAGIVGSIMTIGKTCGAEEKAQSRVDDIIATMERIRNATKGSGSPRVLVSVDRSTDVSSSVYVAGKNTCYDEMITIAGGVNAYTGPAAYPAVSTEGILHMNPQVIIDMVPNIDGKEKGRDKILAQWRKAAGVEAVKTGRVYLFEQDYTVIPGPRFIALLQDMARAIHPELHRN
jgi:iron complex transport system substrate-binding protein